MKTRRSSLRSVFALVALAGSTPAFGNTFTTVNYPGANLTIVTGLSGSTVIGNYTDNDDNTISHGFIYDGTTFTPLDVPGAYSTTTTGISGNTIVGYYRGDGGARYGFIYNGSTFTTVDNPGALPSGDIPKGTFISGISGSTMVGYYTYRQPSSVLGHRGFIYDGTTFTPFDYPGAADTQPNAISGGTIVGILEGTSGFTYDGSTFAPLNVPDAPATYVTGVSGDTVVGYYQPGAAIQRYGFVYDGSAFTTLNYPGNGATELRGVSGDSVYGTAFTLRLEPTGNLTAHGPGFITQIPEPAVATLAGIAALGSLAQRRKRKTGQG